MRRLTRLLAPLSLILALTALAATSRAQEEEADAPSAADAASDRATSFRAVSGSEAEEVPGGTLLIASYALIWIFLMLYLHRVGRLSATVRADVERLSAAIEARPEGEG